MRTCDFVSSSTEHRESGLDSLTLVGILGKLLAEPGGRCIVRQIALSSLLHISCYPVSRLFMISDVYFDWREIEEVLVYHHSDFGREIEKVEPIRGGHLVLCKVVTSTYSCFPCDVC